MLTGEAKTASGMKTHNQRGARAAVLRHFRRHYHGNLGWGWGELACIIGLLLLWEPGAEAAGRLPVVPKWTRFEHTFHSSREYTNALQDATLTVRFISPLGETSEAYGFWDGGRDWRVRFSPDEPGMWKFSSICSDPGNAGLNGKTGAFLCTSPLVITPFHKHGRVVVAPDQQHFEYADGTPFFWMADAVWNGPRQARPKDWERYVQVRASEGFDVAEWSAAPGANDLGESALGGFPDRVSINPRVFQRLDTRLDALSRVGMLSAIAPLTETGVLGEPRLTEEQAVLVWRYALARWGADPVVWLVNFEVGTNAQALERWQRIGQTVFTRVPHTPVVLRLNEFTDAAFSSVPLWVDALAVEPIAQLDSTSLSRTFKSSLPKTVRRHWPVLSMLPIENGRAPAGARYRADEVRRSAYWDLLWTAPAAGLCYGGQGVAQWDTSLPAPGQNGGLPFWERALFMPGAKQIRYVDGLMNSVPFWRLMPEPQAVAVQPGEVTAKRETLAAGTSDKNWLVAYGPEDRNVELKLDALPSSPVISWLNPRTGQITPAVAVVLANSCQFPTPEPGDWVLLVRQGPGNGQ